MPSHLLTERQAEILTRMRDRKDDDDGELVYESGQGWLGYSRVSPKTVFALLRLCAISAEPGSEVGVMERYRINSTGEELLK